MMYVEFMKNFLERALWADSAGVLAIRLILTHISPKTSDSYLVDMMYVEFMKNFLLPDSSELMAVRLILAAWAQKQVIPTL